MAGHLRQHSFTGNTDHDFTGLVANQLLKLNSSGTAIESIGTASTISLSSITNVDYIDFNTATTATVQTGRLIWNDADEIGGLELGMKGGNVTLQVGEENLVRVYNDDIVTLTNGMVVYVYSSQGNTISVRRASSTGETTSARALGVVAESIPVGGRGYVNSYGLIRNLDTSAYTGGTPLYVGTTSGTFTDVKPTAPNHTCLIGFVSRVSATVGSIFVHISNGWELNELHDVYYAHSALTQNNLLYWDTGNTRWQATGTSALGIVTTTGGTLNYVPKFTTGGINLTNSLVYDNGSNVGIGTISPTSQLYVNSTLAPGSKKLLSLVTSGYGEMFSVQDFGSVVCDSNGYGASFTIRASNADLLLTSVGGVQPKITFNQTTGGITSGVLEGVNGSMFLELPNSGFGIGTTYFTPQERLHISGGTIRIQTVNGTEGAGKLAVSDANGTISFSSTTALGLSTTSGTVGGTGTAGYIAKWNSTTGLTNSLISESGTGVTVNGSIYIYGNVDVLGTATTFNTQTIQTADNNITLNLSGSHLSSYGGGITVLSGKTDDTSSTWTIDTAGNWSANTSAVTINGGRITSDGSVGLNNTFWAASSAQPVISVGTRNLFVGNNDTGTFTTTGSFNNLIGSFQGVGLTSGQQNSIIGSYNSLAGLTTGSYNIGINSSFGSNVSGSLAIGSSPDASNGVYIGSSGYYYPNWYLGLGKSATYLFGTTNMNWYASSVSEGDTDKAATIPVWRFNGSRATGSGSSGDIRFAVSLSGASGALWNPLVDKLTVQGNSGFVGINQTTPTAQLHVTGDFKLENSSYGSGKLAVSDANGVISFSSTTALGLGTGTVNKYTTSTSLTAGTASYITHGLGLASATDAIVQLWSGNNLTLGAEISAVTTNQIAVTASVSGTYKIVVMG